MPSQRGGYLGLNICYDGVTKGMQDREMELIPKKRPRFRLLYKD